MVKQIILWFTMLSAVALAQTNASNPSWNVNKTGDVKLAIILVDSYDHQGSDAGLSASQVASSICPALHDYYNEASYGQRNVFCSAADVYGPYVPPSSGTTAYMCNMNNTPSVADSIVTAYSLSAVLAGYQAAMYVVPCDSSDGFAGFTPSAQGNRFYVRTAMIPNVAVVAHEMGHSMGLQVAGQGGQGTESQAWWCGGAAEDCDPATPDLYGDPTDLMGNGLHIPDNSLPWFAHKHIGPHFPAYQKNVLGWMGSRYQAVTTSGVFTLAPLETNDSLLKAFAITVAAGNIYSVEFRCAVCGTWDQDLEDAWSGANPSAGLLIHKTVYLSGFSDGSHWQNGLLNMNPPGTALNALPTGSEGKNHGWENTSLFPGSTFTISPDNIAIRTLSVYGTAATVQVIYSGSSDVTAPTGVTVSAASSVSGTAALSSTCSDDVAPVAVSFNRNGVGFLTSTASPWSVSWDTRYTPNGSMTLTATCYDAAGNSATSSPVTVTVSNTDAIVPKVAMAAPRSMLPPATGVTWQANASQNGTIEFAASCSDNIGCAGVWFTVDGNYAGPGVGPVWYGTEWRLRYDTTVLAQGSHTVQATGCDASGNCTTSTLSYFNTWSGRSGPANFVSGFIYPAGSQAVLTLHSYETTLDVMTVSDTGGFFEIPNVATSASNYSLTPSKPATTFTPSSQARVVSADAQENFSTNGGASLQVKSSGNVVIAGSGALQ